MYNSDTNLLIISSLMILLGFLLMILGSTESGSLEAVLIGGFIFLGGIIVAKDK